MGIYFVVVRSKNARESSPPGCSKAQGKLREGCTVHFPFQARKKRKLGLCLECRLITETGTMTRVYTMFISEKWNKGTFYSALHKAIIVVITVVSTTQL